jgi:hypothetical protein
MLSRCDRPDAQKQVDAVCQLLIRDTGQVLPPPVLLAEIDANLNPAAPP